jgi:phenylalanyl-tRNA synthetase alpha chain
MGKRQYQVPLHPIERSLIISLAQNSDSQTWTDLAAISKNSGLSIDQVRRGIEWLKAKNLLEVSQDEKTTVRLGPEGQRVVEQGLPERRLVKLLEEAGGSSDAPSLTNKLGREEFSIALGRAKKNNWIDMKGSEVSLRHSEAYRKESEETIIERIREKGSISRDELSPQEKEAISSLMKRHKGLVLEQIEKDVRVRLSDQGRATVLTVNKDEIDEITPEIIVGRSWQDKPLRSIDVSSPAPSLYGGRKHPIQMFMDEVKETFVSLGFEEIEGNMAQSALWNFDALFIPQQHSTREMQDTFYISNEQAEISQYSKEAQLIKASHERGEKTGSLGWGYKWSEEEARRVVLRTHTTAVTIKYLSDHKPSEARVFCVGKVFRNEKPNYKHLPEFYQVEGVTVGPKLNVRNLIYILSKFYSKLGFEKVKFWPTYFPYTEPSLQPVVYFEKKQKWLELGGMGVFRPEVTIPLGVRNPVLAWGLGMDRLVMLRYDLEDIRDLFGANLSWLRVAKVI